MRASVRKILGLIIYIMADISFTLEGDINAGRGALGLTEFLTLTSPATVLWTASPRKPIRYYITPDPINNVVVLPEISSSNLDLSKAKIGNSIFVINASGADSLEVQNSSFMPIAGLLPTEAYIITAQAATGDWFPTNITGVGGGPAVLTTKGDLLTRNSGANVRLPVGADGQILTADSVAVDGIAWKDPADELTAKGDLLTHDGVSDVILPVGADGYTLKANSATADGIAWTAPVLTTKGDLLTRDGTSEVRLPVGADTFVLTADSTAADGIKWAAASSGTNEMTFDIVPVMITASSPIYTEIGNFAWDNSVYSGTTAMKIVAWIDSSGSRGIDLQVYDATGAAEIGRISLSAGTAVGPYTTDGTSGVPAGSVYVPITVPVANINIQIRTRKTAGGGSSPTINGIQLHLTQ
jgi:hypothetical protein